MNPTNMIVLIKKILYLYLTPQEQKNRKIAFIILKKIYLAIFILPNLIAPIGQSKYRLYFLFTILNFKRRLNLMILNKYQDRLTFFKQQNHYNFFLIIMFNIINHLNNNLMLFLNIRMAIYCVMIVSSIFQILLKMIVLKQMELKGNQERPKRTLHANKDLVLLFDSHIELLKTTDLSFVSAIQLDEIFIFQSSYPYFYGVRNNKIILIRANQLNPIFKCAENTSFWAAFYRDQNLRYLDWIFIDNQFYFIFLNYQLQVVIIHKERQKLHMNKFCILIYMKIYIKVRFQQQQKKLEISLNKFILGGPFDILDVKSDQNTIVTYESTQSQFCKFLDFSKIQWWIFLYNSKDEQVLLVQDDNLILHLVNCDLQIKKNLFKIGRISQKQISLRNSLLLMQNNKYSLFLFEIQNNLKYRIDQIQFKKEIKYIQPMYSFFLVYLDDWEIYRIYSFSYGNSFDIEKLPIISKVLLKSQIIFCKVISNNDFMIGTESEILQQQKNFIHLIQVQDIQDIIKVKQSLYEFVIIHKSKSQDSIKVKLKKYFLNNFQMISMFELPKPNQSFEYIWPICINENGQYLTIAAKDSKTNNIIALQINIQQSIN